MTQLPIKSVPGVFSYQKADYLTPKIKANYRLFRYDNLDSRYYFEFFKDGTTKSYISITSLASLVLPKGNGYFQWLVRLGEGAEVDRDQKAFFGTLFHVEAMKILMDGSYDFEALSRKKGKYTGFEKMLGPEYRHLAKRWIYDFKKGLASWIQFIKERVVEVIAIEIPMRSERLGVAMTADLVCVLKFNRGEHLALVDLKSFLFGGATKQKTFFDAHEFQLQGCKIVWNDTFPELKLKYVFNWSPINFRGKTPTYTLANQTENKFAEIIDLGNKVKYSAFELKCILAKAEGLIRPPSVVADIKGKVSDISKFNFADHLVTFNI